MKSDWKTNYLRYKGFFLNIAEVYRSKPNLKTYLELILSLITIIVFSIFAIKPTVLTILELSKEIENKKEISLKMSQKIDDLQKANSLLQMETERLPLVERAVPDTAKPEDIILKTEELAINNSLQLSALTISGVKLKGAKDIKNKNADKLGKMPEGVDELPFTTSLSGSYQNIKSFLLGLENMIRPIKFDSLSINSNKKSDGSSLILTVSGRLPFIKK